MQTSKDYLHVFLDMGERTVKSAAQKTFFPGLGRITPLEIRDGGSLI